ncbi:hypothetical protein NDU88_006546 [Pleurodeles waltl]|uniref:Uncharacterized protein n=1 Tax=Pleurodeles waltl TaxID=8319 RepID=A0AAV7LSB3_PLEWA|nr:hypothetical protein NDU88_006546 [Pleurodeles waltl]
MSNEAGPSPALSRSTTALLLPPTLRGGDPPRRGEPVRPGPPACSTRIRRRGGAQRRGEKPHRCAGSTPQDLPFAEAPPPLTSTPKVPEHSDPRPLELRLPRRRHGLTHAAVPARSQLLRCSARPPGSVTDPGTDPGTGCTLLGSSLPVGSALQDRFFGPELELTA